MIYGIGTDICDIRRIRASLDKYGERFAQKVLTDHELQTYRARSARWPERGVRYVQELGLDKQYGYKVGLAKAA